MAIVSLRAAAMLVVCALFAVLVYRLVHSSGGLAQAAKAHRRPAVPNDRLDVIWPRGETWPIPLRGTVVRGGLRLEELRGYPVVVNFWASWCGPCRREATLLAAAAQAHRGDVVFIGVDVHDLTSDAHRFLRAHDVPYVVVRSSASMTQRLGLIGLPETFYVDRSGRIEDVTQGELSAATLERELGRL